MSRGGAGDGDDAFSRFGTRKAGALLAFLAFHADRLHGREALCDLLWPDAPPQTSRARLRVALTSLRHQLEPPGVPAGAVLVSDGREQVGIAGAAVATDVAEVERALATLAADAASATADARVAAGRRIVARFTDPLLTGFYEDWVIAERERLSQAAVERLSALAGQTPPETGIEFARHAARIDPLAEEPLFALLPLLARNGQHAEAQRAFRAFEKRYEAALGDAPSDALRDLARSLPAAAQIVTTPGATPPVAAPAGPPTDPSPPPPVPPPPVRLLPTYLTRFFGRDREREAIRDALAEARLVTLTGPGGAGKTRLAVETARTWPGRCWFVPLSDVGEAERFPGALCDALEGTVGGAGARRGAEDTPGALVARAAAVLAVTPPPLLVLDNLEQIADTVGSPLLALLERAPDVRVLVTSRARLHLPGEREVPVDSLPLPPDGAPPAGEGESPAGFDTLEALARVPSVALFLDRARASRPDFQISDHNRADTVAVCRLLEGYPLALELVAARAATLAPARMRSQLAEQGAVLSVADRRARTGDRHGSLRAAIDWSYRLLSSDLARLFAAVSVFRGGFAAEAAAAVCDAPEAATGEGLARLRSQSLVGSVPAGDEMRYALPESLRAFAAERLAPKQEDEYCLRHARWYAGIAEAAGAALAGPGQTAGLERLDAERENLRAALKFSLEADPPLALRLAGALWKYWDLRGRPTEGRAWLDRALRACPAEGADDADARSYRARALFGAGTMAVTQGDGAAARALLEESLRLYRAAGDDPAAVAGALNSLGLLALGRQAWDEARALLGESLAIRRQVGGPEANLAGSLLNLGVVEWERGDSAASLPLFEEALARYRERGDRVGEGQTLNNLGGVALALGDFAAAEAWYAQSLVAKREVGYPPGLAATLCNVGVAAMYQGRHAEAAARFEESLAIYREMNAPDGVADLLRNLGQIATYRAEWGRAFALLDESLTVARGSDVPDDIAGILEGYALLAGARGGASAAAVPRLLGAADRIRVATDCPLYPSEHSAVDRAAAAARATLGDAAFDAALRDGADLSPDAAAALALALPRG